ncbi:MAG TPA: caspase family protein [Leptospiraceae bacterium]|nr:caspase family protein [Leptospiraceae bacterium]HMX35441.1 caspase family protein [Leptospiraceae bacterium]HMY29674.1 caspase family protein [Leptospiraceae bacterium]HMZ66171.1 caspase family protein [Leptospiraceae bacterium]HNA10294.1 caspase family protein [Leptospiraceae bacterium]
MRVNFIVIFLILFSYSDLFSQKKTETVSLKGNEMGAKRWAIIVGINEYSDKQISSLQKARNDAKLIAQILEEQGQFEEIHLMTDDLSSKNPLYPTKSNIESKIDHVLDFSSPVDTILFFFSGHGISDSNGNGYLLTVDSSLDKSLLTSLTVNTIIKKIKDRNVSKSILFLDACRDVTNSKSFLKEGLKSEKSSSEDFPILFYSTTTGYFSYEDSKSSFGVFTKYLAHGMEGKADTNQDGIVSFGELVDFIQTGVVGWSDQNEKEQKPYVAYNREKFGKIPITASVDKLTSLVDENSFPKSNSKLGAVIRSFVTPGWGQWYMGASEKGLSYFSIFLVLLGNAAYQYQPYQKAKANYESTILIPATPGGGDTLGINYLLFQPKLDAVNHAKYNYNLSIGAVGVFWAWNLLDLFLFKGNNFFWAVNFRLTPVDNSTIYAHSSIQLDQKKEIVFTLRF